jgi:hypothetical protein
MGIVLSPGEAEQHFLLLYLENERYRSNYASTPFGSAVKVHD